MNFPGFVLLVGLLVVVESTVFSWANHEKPEIQGKGFSMQIFQRVRLLKEEVF